MKFKRLTTFKIILNRYEALDVAYILDAREEDTSKKIAKMLPDTDMLHSIIDMECFKDSNVTLSIILTKDEVNFLVNAIRESRNFQW